MEAMDVVARHAEVEALFAEFGLSYTLETEFPVEAVRFTEEVQAREIKHRAPLEMVEQFVYQMRHGAAFPPIVVRQDSHDLIDGNTRWQAAKKVGRTMVEAFVVDCPTEEVAQDLAAALNQKGGLRLTGPEMFNVAGRWAGRGVAPDVIARRLGCSQGQADRWRRQKEGIDRATRLGLEKVQERVPRSTMAKLSAVHLNKPFEEMLKLAADAKLPEKQVAQIVVDVEAAGSEEEALKVVADHRAVLAPCGPPPHRATRSLLPIIRAACANIIKIDGNPSSAFNPGELEQERERWQKVRVVADLVLATIAAKMGQQ